MNPGTLNTILNTAPLIIQGAGKLLKLIRERNQPPVRETTDIPETLEGLKQEIRRIHARLDAGNDSDLEQIKLIEALAKQNELLATSLQKTGRRLNVITALVAVSLFVSFFMIFVTLFSR